MAAHRTRYEEQWEHVNRWLESGLSKAAYCREANLPYHLLIYWSRRHARGLREVATESGRESGFVELMATPSLRSDFGVALPAVVIRLPGGVELACGSLPNAQWVRQLTLEVTPC